jgi:hypothetical protein
MKEEIITFKTAKLAKEKGFNLRIQKFYLHKGVKDVDLKKHPVPKLNSADNELRYSNWNNRASRTSAPTQSLLQRWLREVHNINVYCTPTIHDDKFWINNIASHNPVFIGNYEEALEKGLIEALKILKI